MEDDALFAVIATFFVIFVFLILLAIILYIFLAIGLFKIAKREGREDLAWLAWIPVANTFLMMVLLERAVHSELRGKLTLIYGIALAASIVLGGFIPYASILPLLIFFYAFYFLAKRYSTNPVLHLVITIITFNAASAIQIFLFRNRDVVDATGLDGAAATESDDINL